VMIDLIEGNLDFSPKPRDIVPEAQPEIPASALA